MSYDRERDRSPQRKHTVINQGNASSKYLKRQLADERMQDVGWAHNCKQEQLEPWVFDVLCILTEQYSIVDASIYSISRKRKDGQPHSVACNIKGTCPVHGVRHGQNNWSLINTMGYDTTMFICHNDNTKKLIHSRLPIPVDYATVKWD